MSNNLEQLTQKIIKAVPSINEKHECDCQGWKYQKRTECDKCRGNNGFMLVPRPILLEDVLITLGEYSQVLSDSKIIKISIWNGASYSYICDWLLNTPLHLQSEETISEINKLIR